VVHADDLLDLLYNDCDPAGLLVRPDAVIDGYNRWCTTFDKRDSLIPPLSSPSVTPAAMHADRARHWLMPPAFRDLDVRALLLPRCPDAAARARLNREMDLFAARDLLGLLQLMCALVDYFRRDGIVWGVGRGSSCASYALFLIGVHKVDALQYDLDIGEFLHD
jgi:DNA polymerase III alpha subunit